jgi:peptidoglycan/xylan/chitin deacetylase (PgdA/CDA1 family)
VAAALGLCLMAVMVVGMGTQASSVLTHGSRARPWVALTFDDGWSADRCEQIVRTLRAKRATATFLINGSIVGGSPARWRAMLSGFAIANHTRTHPFLTHLGAADIRSQIVTNERIIEQALGRQMLPLLRPPYGAYDSQVVQVADSLGYRTILWDTSGGDTTSGATTSSVIRNATRGGNGAVVLLHCGPSVTPGAVGPIIDSYRARGYQLVDLAHMFGLASAPPPDACRVKDVDAGTVRRSFRKAAAAASPGDRLLLRGTCRGSTAIAKDLLVRGTRTKDSGPPTLDAKGDGRVLTIRRGATVVLRNLTITGGSDPEGGGIRNVGTLSLRDVVVRANRSRHGGGINNRPGAVLHLNGETSVRGSRARFGGGVWNAGSLTATGSSTIGRNVASRNGGGLYAEAGGSVTLRDEAVIRANEASGDGGGIWNAGELELRDASLVRGNEASGDGGGIWNAGVLSMSGSSAIVRNAAAELGGGILDAGSLEGVTCGPEGNVDDNSPDDCSPVG